MERDFLADARDYADRASGGLATLHIGPLDYNITTTADYLRTAAACLEEHLRQVEREPPAQPEPPSGSRLGGTES